MKKRGQISPIVIGAIVVVFGVIIVFLVKDYFLKTQFELQYEQNLKVPMQVEPIVKYMGDCLSKLSEEGVNALGQQGGYIDIPYEPLPTTPYTPLSSFMERFPNSGERTALWFRETPNGIKTTKVPTLKEMETSLSLYINNNINRCINNLTTFVSEGYTIEFTGQPKATAKILDNEVDITLNYPMNILLKDLKFPIKNHVAKVPVSLGKLFKLSQQIMDAENEQLFFEKQTIDDLVVYNGDIPFSGIDLSCSPKIWSKTKTISIIKNVLSKNIPQIRIKGTNYELPNDDFKYYEFDALDGSYPEISAYVSYSPLWPTLIEVSPSNGDVMKGSDISKKASDPALAIISSIYCLTDYHFVYDIKYPIMITLTDSTGYSFQFATEVIIDKNEPRQNLNNQLYVPEPDYNICDYPSNPITVSTLYPTPDGTLVPLTDAEVVLKCYPGVCSLGTTKIIGGEAMLTSTAIPCANAVLEARKENYYSGKIIVDTNDVQENIQPIILEPYYTKNITIKVIDKQTGMVREPYDSEQVVVQLTHKATGYTTSVSTPIDEPVQLLVGDYEITSYVTATSTWPITYTGQTLSNCVNVRASGILGLFKTEEKCFETTIPSMELDSVIKGGVKFDYGFARQDLASDTPITIYTITDPIPGSMESLSAVYQSIEKNYLDPSFKYPTI